jgi:hypothetical protein
LNNEQKKALVGQRHTIAKQRRNLAKCMQILGELDTGITENLKSLDGNMSRVMDIISPTQQVKWEMGLMFAGCLCCRTGKREKRVRV